MFIWGPYLVNKIFLFILLSTLTVYCTTKHYLLTQITTYTVITYVLNCDLDIFQKRIFSCPNPEMNHLLVPSRYFDYFTLIIVKAKQLKRTSKFDMSKCQHGNEKTLRKFYTIMQFHFKQLYLIYRRFVVLSMIVNIYYALVI